MQTLDIALLQPNTIWHDPQANHELIAHIVIDKLKLETTREKPPFLQDRDDFTLR